MWMHNSLEYSFTMTTFIVLSQIEFFDKLHMLPYNWMKSTFLHLRPNKSSEHLFITMNFDAIKIIQIQRRMILLGTCLNLKIMCDIQMQQFVVREISASIK